MNEEIKKNLKGLNKRISSNVSKLGSSLSKLNKKKVSSKGVLKKEQTQVTIPNYKAPSVLGDENRFFKGTMEETKRSMFFS
jgi:hypothetical protein